MAAFCDQLVTRVRFAGGRAGDFNFAADILNQAKYEATLWTHRADDVSRIPYVLGDAAQLLRFYAKQRLLQFYAKQ